MKVLHNKINIADFQFPSNTDFFSVILYKIVFLFFLNNYVLLEQ